MNTDKSEQMSPARKTPVSRPERDPSREKQTKQGSVMKVKNKKDFGLGLFCILLAIGIAILTMQLKPSLYEGDPGPRMFPMFASVILAVCGIGLLVTQEKEQGAFLTKAQWKSAGKLFSLYIAFVLLLWLFGFIIAVPVVLFVLTFVLSRLSVKDAPLKKRLLMSAVFGIVGGAVLYLAYVVGLDAQMPKGLIFKLLGM